MKPFELRFEDGSIYGVTANSPFEALAKARREYNLPKSLTLVSVTKGEAITVHCQ